MTTKINKRWLLDKRPKGIPDDSCWKWEEIEIPNLDDGKILIKSLFLSIDPYMRGRMNDSKSYVDPLKLGDVMVGESVGIVVESRSNNFQEGDYGRAAMAGLSMAPGPVGWAGLAGEALLGAPTILGTCCVKGLLL